MFVAAAVRRAGPLDDFIGLCTSPGGAPLPTIRHHRSGRRDIDAARLILVDPWLDPVDSTVLPYVPFQRTPTSTPTTFATVRFPSNIRSGNVEPKSENRGLFRVYKIQVQLFDRPKICMNFPKKGGCPRSFSLQEAFWTPRG